MTKGDPRIKVAVYTVRLFLFLYNAVQSMKLLIVLYDAKTIPVDTTNCTNLAWWQT